MVYLALTLWLASDWLNQGMRTQPGEYQLTPANAGKMKLLWTRNLSAGPLSAPVILGRLITYRGTVELVFVSSASGQVFAVDADFGKTFWTRQLPPGSTKTCPSPATPAISPDAPGHDEDDDGPQPLRPVYVVSPGGLLYGLHPIDGKDVQPPRRIPCPAYLVAGPKRVVGQTRFVSGPVTANGLAFDIAGGRLRVSDERTGATLFSSEPAPAPSALALANGHACFTTEGALACYGIPLEP
jgi:hypothetical protein